MKTTTKCRVCQKSFTSWNPKPTFCSTQCKGLFQRHPIDQSRVTELYQAGMTQEEVALKLNTTRKVVENTMKRLNLKARKAVKRDQWGDKNHRWKGDGATKAKLHTRLYRRFGKPDSCSVCGTTNPSKSYDWANLTGRYADVRDFKRMCRSCHWKYDKKILNIKKMRTNELPQPV